MLTSLTGILAVFSSPGEAATFTCLAPILNVRGSSSGDNFQIGRVWSEDECADRCNSLTEQVCHFWDFDRQTLMCRLYRRKYPHTGSDLGIGLVPHQGLMTGLPCPMGHLPQPTTRLGEGRPMEFVGGEELVAPDSRASLDDDSLSLQAPNQIWEEMKDDLGIEAMILSLDEYEAMGNHEDFDAAVEEMADLNEWVVDDLLAPYEEGDWASVVEAMQDPEWETIQTMAKQAEEMGLDQSASDLNMEDLSAMHKWLGTLMTPLANRDFETVLAAMAEDPFNLRGVLESKLGSAPNSRTGAEASFDDDCEYHLGPESALQEMLIDLGICGDVFTWSLEDLQAMGNHPNFDAGVDELFDLAERDWALVAKATRQELRTELGFDDEEIEQLGGEQRELFWQTAQSEWRTVMRLPNARFYWVVDDILTPLANREFEKVIAAIEEDPYNTNEDESEDVLTA